ncbi:methyltransferase [Agromyces rhizosphaerae]|uniref:Methyltransferase n=1 Tax=Agromyces rhizosphaerae TaxID=88374 RepID=A0A9W6CY99_9MICO|nr:methyltransferase [Agromyces rhizosphaerae]GLI28236.1 methyltransferase [Agromyces rhizosphaerae]
MVTATEMRIAAALAADLSAARYTVAGLDGLWGDEAEAALHRGDAVPAARLLERMPAGADPRVTLALCFVLGLGADRDDLARALPTAGLDGAVALGLVDVDGARVRARVDLRPYAFADRVGEANWWIASDPGEVATGAPLAEDHVLGVGGASSTLAALQWQEPVDSVLDLGTGCGIQAMHASRHADRVVATDISARALRFAELNAALNGVTGIEFRLGSLFDPVAGERFDRIVSNPPFVITPRRDDVPAYEYRDGGMVGDALVAQVLAGLADHLEPGGSAQLLADWEYRGADGDGLERASDWFGPDLEYWLIERDRVDPIEYAETWVRDGGTRPGTPEYGAMVRAWLDDFEARGVDAVGFGYVVARRPADGVVRLRRTEQQHGPLGSGAPGPHLEACVGAFDRIVDDVAAARPVVAGDVTEQRHHWPGSADPTAITLSQGGGFARTVDAGTALAALVGACDGTLTVAAIAGAIAGLLDADEAALTEELEDDVVELALCGMLAPATDAADDEPGPDPGGAR